MATQNALSECVTKLRECSICFEQTSLPKVLPCQHTFCLNCLTKTVDSIMKKIQCAVCRKVHNLPNNGVKGFPNNLTLMTLIDSMKISVGKKRKREEVVLDHMQRKNCVLYDHDDEKIANHEVPKVTFQCDRCSILFDSVEEKERHMKLGLGKIKQFQCADTTYQHS